MKMAATTNYGSFVHDLQCLSAGLGLDLRTILISRLFEKVSSVYDDIDDEKQADLITSLDNWNVPQSRKRFIEILEERVVRQGDT